MLVLLYFHVRQWELKAHSTLDASADTRHVAKREALDLAWQNIQNSDAHWEGIQTNREADPPT